MAVKPQIIEKLIQSGINGNHLIHDASHVAINLKTKGFLFWKKTEIHISGRVDTDREKEEIDKILEAESKGLAIINNLRVHRR
ncbi:MAG: hypothetical protein CMN78_04570 [Spirochaetales bacterium]|nr:hypothetical protein [Spirochaetales bacterium]